MPSLATLGFSLLWIASSAGGAEISLPRITVQVGSTVVQAELLLAAQGADLAALQVDLVAAPGLTINAEIGTAASRAGKQLVSGEAAGGQRFLIYGLNQTSLPDGILLTLSITLPKDASGSYALRLTGALASDSLGAEVALDCRDGTITVAARRPPER